jgi:hypothetical protein
MSMRLLGVALSSVLVMSARAGEPNRTARSAPDGRLAVYFLDDEPTPADEASPDAEPPMFEPVPPGEGQRIVPRGEYYVDEQSGDVLDGGTDEAYPLGAFADDCGECGPPCAIECAPPRRGLLSNVCLGGWLDQGFTWNPDRPADRLNTPVTFNYRSNDYQLNQLYLFMEKPVGMSRDRFDAGGRVDLLYGTDFRFTTALGLETDLAPDGTIRQRWNSDDSFYGLAMPQLYAEFFAPLAEGLSVKIGHFYTIVGYEELLLFALLHQAIRRALHAYGHLGHAGPHARVQPLRRPDPRLGQLGKRQQRPGAALWGQLDGLRQRHARGLRHRHR